MKRLLICIVLASAMFSVTAFAQSSKFDASWDDTVKMVHAYVDSDTASACLGDSTDGTGTEGDPCILAEALMATLDVAQQKDLLIGVSAQIGLHTLTQAKGKNTDPSLGSATASGSVNVTLELREANGSGTGALVQTAAPGTVTFAARLQELKVDVTDTDTDFLTEVIVSLLLDTTAAHHFNFIGVDLDQGVYDVVAVFDLSAFVAIVGEDAIARAKVTLGPRMVTVQEVRAAKDSLTIYQ
jgi:hypothetical protein